MGVTKTREPPRDGHNPSASTMETPRPHSCILFQWSLTNSLDGVILRLQIKEELHIPTLVKCVIAVLNALLLTLVVDQSEVIRITGTFTGPEILFFYFQLYPKTAKAIETENMDTAVRYIQNTYNAVCGLTGKREADYLKQISQTRMFSVVYEGTEHFRRVPLMTTLITRATLLKTARVAHAATVERKVSSDDVGDVVALSYADTFFVN